MTHIPEPTNATPSALPALLAAMTALNACTVRQLSHEQRQRAAADLDLLAHGARRASNTHLGDALQQAANGLRQCNAGGTR